MKPEFPKISFLRNTYKYLPDDGVLKNTVWRILTY